MKDYIRLTDVLTSYWERLRGGEDVLPHEDQINPEALERVWDDCFLVEMVGDHKYKYDYMGKHLIEAYGDDFSHDEIEFLVSPHTHRVAEKFNEVVDSKKAVYDDGEFTNSDGVLVKYRTLMLPFVDKGDKVSYILGGMRWRGF